MGKKKCKDKKDTEEQKENKKFVCKTCGSSANKEKKLCKPKKKSD